MTNSPEKGKENNQQQKNNGEKGYSLEYMVTGLFQSQGYLARRSIPLQYGPVNQDATDIDVLGIQFTLPFKGHRIICDCKNKQKSRPYERIFWAKGLGEFTNASEVYVALPKTSSEIISFALTGSVRILTLDKVNQFSKTPSGSYGLADEMFYRNFFSAVDSIIKNNKHAEKAWLTTRKLYLKEDPYVATNIAFDLLDQTTKQLNATKYNSDINLFWKYLCCELVVLIGLQVLWICADTYSLPEKSREDRIITKLTYGDLEPSQVHKLLNSAKDLANELIKANIPSSYLPNQKLIDFGEFPPPQFAFSLVGLVERALQNPQWYVDMPQLLDFLLFEQGLKGKDFSDNAYRDMFRSGLSDEKLKAAKNILSFIKDAVGFEWKMIWSKPSDSTPITTDKLKKNDDTNIQTNNAKKLEVIPSHNEKKDINHDKQSEVNQQIEIPMDITSANETVKNEIDPIKKLLDEHILTIRNTIERDPKKF